MVMFMRFFSGNTHCGATVVARKAAKDSKAEIRRKANLSWSDEHILYCQIICDNFIASWHASKPSATSAKTWEAEIYKKVIVDSNNFFIHLQPPVNLQED